MNLFFKFSILVMLVFLLPACIVIEHPFTKLPPGKWIGILKLDKEIVGTPIIPQKEIDPFISFETVTSGELPFEFDVVYENPDSFYILLINSIDTFIITDIKYGTDRTKAKDTFEILFPFYNTMLKGYFEENVMEGEWIVMDKENYRIPFVARYGQSHKFTDLQKEPLLDISGIWKVEMGLDQENPTSLVASFQQKNNNLTGTFSGSTGDYRFLSGTVQNNKIYLSQFDGSSAYLIEAKIESDGTLVGIFRSGKHYQATWRAVKDETATLQIPTHNSSLIGNKIDFAYSDPNGKIVKLSDPQFEGKPKIIQILGSWCHNCYDEARFFNQMDSKYREQIQIIGLACERAKDTVSAMNRIRSFSKQTETTYPVLLASLSTKKEDVIKYLPFLDKIDAYPTSIYLNANNEIISIKSGFFGPASHLHTEWADDFYQTLNEMINHEK